MLGGFQNDMTTNVLEDKVGTLSPVKYALMILSNPTSELLSILQYELSLARLHASLVVIMQILSSHPIDDWKLILGASDSVSSITETSSSTPSRSSLVESRQMQGHDDLVNDIMGHLSV
jgi:hypothetical protein